MVIDYHILEMDKGYDWIFVLFQLFQIQTETGHKCLGMRVSSTTDYECGLRQNIILVMSMIRLDQASVFLTVLHEEICLTYERFNSRFKNVS